MRSARRTGGVKAARAVFKRAREDPRSTWQVGWLIQYDNKLDELILCVYRYTLLQP